MLSALEICHLSKKYGANEALKGISFEVKSGEIFGLLGPNGAGKTTLISIITTLETPTGGTVKIFGNDVLENSLLTKSNVGVVHQEVITSGFFTVREILKFISGYYGHRNNDQRIDYLLHRLSLYEHRNKLVKQLSGGMKRRLMIAKALCHDPKILLLDEPTAGVDIQLREDLWKFVADLKKEGLTILLTTHYLEEAENLCDRVAIINQGAIECVGPTQEIIHRFSQKRVKLSLSRKLTDAGVYFVGMDNEEYNFVVPPEMKLGALLSDLGVSSSDLVDVKIDEGSLEEAFVRVLNQRKGRL